MKNDNKLILAISLIFISIFMMVGCKPDTEPPLTDLSGDKGEPAIITSALSSSGVTVGTATGYAGVTEVTIKGDKFSTNTEDNYVYFGSAKAEVLSATTNELVVKAPIIYGDSLRLKISKPRVEDYSNTVLFKLTSVSNEYYKFLPNQKPYASTLDADGNLYFSLTEGGVGVGVWKISANDGKLENYAPKKSETFYDDLKFHPDGYLLGVAAKYKYAIFKITKDETPTLWAKSSDIKIVFQAMDFDVNKNLWLSGKGGKIVSFTKDKVYTEFPYDAEIKSLRVFDNYLYAVAKTDANINIVRFKINSADNLGDPEVVFDFSNKMGDNSIVANSLTFSESGTMYIATNGTNPIIVVYPNGAFSSWYKELIDPEIISFTWSSGTTLFATRKAVEGVSTQTILKIDMEKSGAPDFGRN